MSGLELAFWANAIVAVMTGAVVITNRNARSTGITVDRVIDRLLSDVPERLSGDDKPPQPGEVFDPQDWSPGDLMPW